MDQSHAKLISSWCVHAPICHTWYILRVVIRDPLQKSTVIVFALDWGVSA
jgi:hypothetical protein